MNTTYRNFLESKIVVAERHGMDVSRADIHPDCFPHQKDAIQWAVSLGRALIAMSFGLGKTRIQCEIARNIHLQTGKKFLVICPLGVKHQFIFEDGPILGVSWEYCKTDDDIKNARTPYIITNYERVRDGNITPALHDFAGVSLDEGSVLRSLGSKTYQVFIDLLKDIPYRYVATATPAPNEYKEIIHYAEFLSIMDRGQALTRWFKRDSGKAGHLTIHPIHERDFWMWVASWALFLFTPGDLGYSDEGYSLPPLKVHWHRIKVDQRRAWSQTDNRNQYRLFLDAAGGVSEAAAEKRETLKDRIERMVQIVTDEGYEGVSQSILPGPQRESQRIRPQLLSEEQREDKGAEQTLAGAESGALQGIDETALNSKSGKNKSPKQQVVLRKQRSGKHLGSKEQTSSRVRVDDGGIRRDGEGSERLLRDLSATNEETGGRSRSRNRKGAGASLPSVQYGTGSVSGQPSTRGAGSELSSQFIIWCHLNIEQDVVEQVMGEMGISVSSVRGTLDVDETEKRLYEWKDKKTSVLLSKPRMLGSGVNLQQSHKVVFLGIDYKFQDFIQAIHRCHRFGQSHSVDVHIIYAESEDNVVETLRRKWEQHNKLVDRMREIVRKYGMATTAIQADLSRSIGIFRMENKQKLFTAVNNDCVLEMENIPADTIDLIHTSIPFGNHYSYTAKYEDFGHNPSDGDFWDQMDFLVPDLFRILKPGRVAAIHVKDRILYGHQTKSGFMEVEEFSDDCVKSFRKHGFLYEGRRTIVTDVVRENASTYRLGWSEMARDASKMGSGLPEYLLLFRKPPTSNDTSRADEPVTKDKADYTRARWQLDAHSFWRSNGNGPLTPAELYDYEAHVEHVEQLDRKGGLSASFFMEPPKSMSEYVWDDIVYMRTLNSEQAKGRLENHICPLPFDIVERTIRLYSNEGDLVLDPFAGLFTVIVKAMELGRIGYGIELNEEYYAAGLKYCQAAEQAKLMPTLFDYLETMQALEAEKAAQ